MEFEPEYTLGFGHPEDPRIQTGVRHWKEFISSLPWRDIMTFLEERVEMIGRELRDVDNLNDLLRLQQEVKDMEWFLTLPTFLSSQRDQQDREDERRKDEEQNG